jgi:drug/metabolite transporter (DMT)-like permease
MTIVMALSAAVVLVLAYLGFGRPMRWVELSFAAFVTASVLLLASPTPLAYTRELRATRPGGPAVVNFEHRAYQVLFAVSAACLLSAAGFHRPRHEDGEIV